MTDPAYPISLKLYEADNETYVRDIHGRIGSRKIQVQLNQPGVISVEVPLEVSDSSSTMPNPEAGDLTRGRVLRGYVNDLHVHSGTIRPRKQTSIDPKGESAHARSVDAAGLISEWDQAVLPPDPSAVYFAGATTRHFGWMSREADRSALDDGAVLRAVLAAGEAHPDPWIWAFTDYLDMTGLRYVTYDYTPESDELVAVHNGITDHAALWAGSTPAGETDPPPTSAALKNYRFAGKIPGGVTTRFGWDLTAYEGSTPALAASAGVVDSADEAHLNLSTFRWHTGVIPVDLGGDGTALYPFKVSATAGGPTAKQIIRSAITQVQAEQEKLAGWTVYGDDDTVDANGNALDQIYDFPATIGSKLATGFAADLTKSWCDLAVDLVGKQVRVYRFRELGMFHESPGTVPILNGVVGGRYASGTRKANIIQLGYEERPS